MSDTPEIRKEYITVLRPCLHFHGIQIKSLDIFRRFAAAVDEIEEIAGIKCCTISLEEIFVCPGIVFPPVNDQTPMERLLIGLIQRLETGG